MNHPAELAIHSFLQKVMLGKASMNKATINRVAKDVKDALGRQFSGRGKKDFKLRMSNIGRKKCQLWFDKNEPENKIAESPFFIINMILGDIVEAVFKGLLRASDVKFGDSEQVTLQIEDDKIDGTYDLVINGKVDDVKSSSPWSYENKFKDFETLQGKDSFGYVSQLVGYAKAKGVPVGGWWVVNKANGNFKYVSAHGVDVDSELKKIKETIDYINNNEPFERCYEPVEETYYGKPSGNLKLGIECSLCSYREKCWDDLKVLPSMVSRSATPPLINYVYLADAQDTVQE
jgi:hypothetical protein|tara:strand:+ start:2848 stop:3717 length:870 start_codon:yes stop_codon:yes gene_type:complete